MKKILSSLMIVWSLFSSAVYGMPGASQGDELAPRTGPAPKRSHSKINTTTTASAQEVSVPGQENQKKPKHAEDKHSGQHIIPLTPEEREELNDRLIGMGFKTEFAIPTTDTGFKHLLALDEGNKNVVISFLNTFIPPFRSGDPVVDVSVGPTAIPVLPREGQKQTFMDMYVTSQSRHHYIIEMQARRHINFDERALFYACATYSRQIEEKAFADPVWYFALKPVIALQVLDFDTNRIKGIKGEIKDIAVERVKANPLPEGEFVKHYELKCRNSGQVIDYLQLIQIELGRAEQTRRLYPPQGDFTIQEWWLSVLKYAGKYTKKDIDSFEDQEIIMPEDIKKAFSRLDYSKWSPREIKEMKRDVIDREDNAVLLAVERSEGIAEGKAEGGKTKALDIARKMLRRGRATISEIAEDTDLSEEEITQLQQELLVQEDVEISHAPASMD